MKPFLFILYEKYHLSCARKYTKLLCSIVISKAHKSYMMNLCTFWILINFNQFLSKLINFKLLIKKKVNQNLLEIEQYKISVH